MLHLNEHLELGCKIAVKYIKVWPKLLALLFQSVRDVCIKLCFLWD